MNSIFLGACHRIVGCAALLSAIGLLGCKSVPPARPAVSQPLVSNHGYALLFDLLGDEQNVSKLLIVKRERDELENLIKEISRTSGEAHKRLEAFGKADPRLNLKDLGLPPVEMETRKAIGKTRGRELLTDKGREFELQLLLSQNEALTYGGHLAVTTAGIERNPQRAQFLQQLSRDLTRLREKVIALLLANYHWPAK